LGQRVVEESRRILESAATNADYVAAARKHFEESSVPTYAPLVGARSDSRNWARLILQREEAGEVMPLLAIQFAREALGYK
jgi:hypothetical protein